MQVDAETRERHDRVIAVLVAGFKVLGVMARNHENLLITMANGIAATVLNALRKYPIVGLAVD